MNIDKVPSAKRSLYSHLFRALIPGFIVTLLLSGWVAKTLIGRNLSEEFDRTLDKQAIALIGITEQDEDGVELEIYEEAMANYFSTTSNDYFEVHDTNGNLLFSSESIGNSTLGYELPDSRIPQFKDIELPSGADGRLVRRIYFPKIDIDDDDEDETDISSQSKPFYPPGQIIQKNSQTIVPTQVVVTVASSRNPLKEMLNELNLILLVTAIVTTSVLVLLQNRAIKRAVRPINTLVKDLSSRSDSAFTNQISLDTHIKELDVLSRSFNDLLQSVNNSMKREKEFSSNLAHEIRTPIAEIQSLLEVNRLWPEDKTIREDLTANLLSSLKRMDILVSNILAIGRGDSGQLDTDGAYNIVTGIEQLLKTHHKRIEDKALDFHLNLDSTCVASLGAHQWPIILNNLIDNAIDYSPSGSVINVDLICECEKNRFNLSVANPTNELVAADVERVFDRLWRKDSSRTSDLHSGLGLSLVRTLCEILHYSLSANINQKSKFEITLSGESTLVGSIC